MASNKRRALDRLLARVKQRAEEEYGRAEFAGLVLSRNKDELHLANELGVVAIPISEIEQLVEVPELDERYARFVVRRPDKVRVLHRLDLSLASEKLPDDLGGVLARPAGTTSTICKDLSTITGGGEPDATDGAICRSMIDDPPPMRPPTQSA